TKTMPANSATIIEHSFTITDPEKILPPMKLEVAVDSPVGSLNIRDLVLPIAYRRIFSLSQTDDSITIDGKAAEPAWSSADAIGKFVDGGGKYQNPDALTTVKLLRDNTKIYVMVNSIRSNNNRPIIGRSINRSDHVMIYLADNSQELKYYIDAKGRTQSEPNLGQSAKAAVQINENQLNWEIALPLQAFIKNDETIEQPLVLNIIEHRGNKDFYLSPTFGNKPTRHTGGQLKFK
ncbi:MAG: hypothetical protein JSV03_01380, partial [Planctomycetota bacterium]